MLIDTYLPRFDVCERHTTRIHAPVDRVYVAVRRLNLQRSRFIKTLFRLRGLPASALTLEGLRKLNFAILAEDPPRELLLGLVGRFWTLSGDLQAVDHETFARFDRAGYAKAAWSFTLTPTPRNVVALATETRVLCLDDTSRRRFERYWRFIGPFSGLIRREMLRTLRSQAQQQL